MLRKVVRLSMLLIKYFWIQKSIHQYSINVFRSQVVYMKESKKMLQGIRKNKKKEINPAHFLSHSHERQG